MQKLIHLVAEGNRIEATRLVNKETNVEDLSDAVSFLKSMSPEEIKEMGSNIESKISEKNSLLKNIKEQAVETQKQKTIEKIAHYTESIKENEAILAKIEERVLPVIKEIQEYNARPCKCGGNMVKRTSYKGQFLGCNNFPKCKETSDIKELSGEMKELNFKRNNLKYEINMMKSYLNSTQVDKIKDPLYTKELAEAYNQVKKEISDLKSSLRILEQVKKGEKTNLEQSLSSLIEAEKVRPYLEAFDTKPYMKSQMLIENFDTLKHIENEVKNKLAGYENFEALNFCDVSAGGIQLRGMHKQVQGYSYGAQVTLKYDFSNVEEVIETFVKSWINSDTPEQVSSYLSFLSDGEKYGWD